jgi:hypothetical protein
MSCFLKRRLSQIILHMRCSHKPLAQLARGVRLAIQYNTRLDSLRRALPRLLSDTSIQVSNLHQPKTVPLNDSGHNNITA